MIEDEKMQVAVFRFGVISDFVTAAQMSRAEKRRLMRDKCARKWQIPFSNGDLKSLQPKDRCDQGKSRAMDEDTCLSLIGLKLETPTLTVPQLIEQMNRQNRVSPGIVLNNSTVYRFLHQQNLVDLPIKKPVDRRKFEAVASLKPSCPMTYGKAT